MKMADRRWKMASDILRDDRANGLAGRSCLSIVALEKLLWNTN